jgi:hypothetical protein
MKEITWEKRGCIYIPSGEGFFKTHATRSIPWQVNSDVLRLYFSSRDSDDRPLPTYIDVDIHNPSRVLFINDKPLLELGRPGTFDDSGITPTCILDHKNGPLLYYVGWKRRRVNVTIEPSIGLARFDQSGEILERVFEGPILAQDINHPILVAAPFVLHDDGKLKMWYCSGTEWKICEGGPEMIYRVCYAESEDGFHWTPRTKPVIDYKYDGEVISAPWVIKHKSNYYMWYSTRGSSSREAKRYVIGYAESPDGIEWMRMDEKAGICRSDSGWDSEMICYPSFFSVGSKTYMFYSGNNVGKGGLGYAVTENMFG